MFHGEGSEGRVMTYSSFLCLLILGKDKKIQTVRIVCYRRICGYTCSFKGDGQDVVSISLSI